MRDLYVTRVSYARGDSFDLCVTFDPAEAESAAVNERNRKDHEREVSIETYHVANTFDLDTDDAEALFNGLLDMDDDQVKESAESRIYYPQWTLSELEDMAIELASNDELGTVTEADILQVASSRGEHEPLSANDMVYIKDRLNHHTRD